MKKIFLSYLLVTFLTGCATTTLKAPCDATGYHCKNRLKVNEWYTEQ